MAGPGITIIPNLTIQTIDGSGLGQSLVSVAGVSFTGTVLFYDKYFPVPGGVQTAPGISVPFYTPASNARNNSALVLYIRNLDQTGVVACTLWVPNNIGGSSQLTLPVNIGPGGFLLSFNPVNTGANGVAVGSAGSVGFGASNGAFGTMNLNNLSGNVNNTTPLYVEILIAA